MPANSRKDSELISLYSVFTQLVIHYSNIMNNLRILVFSTCTILLAGAADIMYNNNTSSAFYFSLGNQRERYVFAVIVLIFAFIVNYSIHQILIANHAKFKIAEENLISIEKKLQQVNFGRNSKDYRDSLSAFMRLMRYYGTIYVIYFACLVLLAIVTWLSA